MSINCKVLGDTSGRPVPTQILKVYQGAAATITPGDMLVPDNSYDGYWRIAANGEASTYATEVAVASSTSTEGVATNGTVEAHKGPNMRIAMTATTPANLSQAVAGDYVTLDVSAGVQTADENDVTNGFLEIENPETSKPGSDSFDTTNGEIVVIANSTKFLKA